MHYMPSTRSPACSFSQDLDKASEQQANAFMAMANYSPSQLLDSQDTTVQEASIALLHAPRDYNILQTYALVTARPSSALNFEGLVPLLQQQQPQQADRIIVGFLMELANYGCLSHMLR